jgi:calcium-dependent protein kinase
MGCIQRKPNKIVNKITIQDNKNKNQTKSFHFQKSIRQSSNNIIEERNTGRKKSSLFETASKIKQIKSLAEGDEIKVNLNINQNISSIQNDYNILSKIGKGSFGYVFKVHHKRTNQFRAMKVIKQETIKLQDDDKKFLKEIEILIKADHPNIIKIYEYFIDDINYYVIMEYVSGGELYDTITSWNNFNEKKAAYIMNQILSAVSYLHSHNIIHRDLKPENILVENKKKSNDKDKEEEINIKIIDFGTCNIFSKNKNLSLKVGSPYYIAPEVLQRNYNEKCDIWSCGVILYVLLVGYPPFSGNSTDELLMNVSKGKYSLEGKSWMKISIEAKNLVKSMLEFHPKNRISALNALNSKWIKDNITNELNNEEMEYFSSVLKNIKNWDSGEKFQQATLAYIVHFIFPSEEIEEMKRVFKTIDKNGDGMLTYDELLKGFEIVFGNQIHNYEINKIIEDIDGNADGYISYEEFLRVAINKNKLINEMNLKLAFDSFDINKDGKLSAEEIKQVLGTNHNEYVNELIKVIDVDENNEIDFEEFKELMLSLLSKKDTMIGYDVRSNKINKEDKKEKQSINIDKYLSDENLLNSNISDKQIDL